MQSRVFAALGWGGMKLMAAAACAVLALGAGAEAQASSFVMVAAPVKARSVVTFGNAPMIAAVPPEPDAIRTSSLGQAAPGSPAAASAELFARNAPQAPSQPWPPRLSVSMVAFGTPAPRAPPVRVASHAAQPPMPMLIRGGMFDHGPLTSQPAPQGAEPAAAAAPQPSQTRASERREKAARREEAARASAPPSAPAEEPPPALRRLPE